MMFMKWRNIIAMTRARLSKGGPAPWVYFRRALLVSLLFQVLGHGHTSIKAFHIWHSPISVSRQDYLSYCCFPNHYNNSFISPFPSEDSSCIGSSVKFLVCSFWSEAFFFLFLAKILRRILKNIKKQGSATTVEGAELVQAKVWIFGKHCIMLSKISFTFF